MTYPNLRIVAHCFGLLGLLVLAGSSPSAAGVRELPMERRSLALPGPPSEMLAVDLDEDGHRDLVLFVASTHWGELGVEEETRLDEVGALVEVMTVVPALLDRRELRLYRGTDDGSLAAEPVVLEQGGGLHALALGPPGASLLALTDEGVAAVRLRRGEGGDRLEVEPLVVEPPVLAGSDLFVAALPFAARLNADELADLAVPVADGLAIHLAKAGGGFERVGVVELPRDEPRDPGGRLTRNYPLPELRDLDGDRLAELVLLHPRRGRNEAMVRRNLGRGRFAAPLPLAPGLARETRGQAGLQRDVVFFGDIDGDGRSELLSSEMQDPGKDASMREGLDQARRPRVRFVLQRLGADFAVQGAPLGALSTEGHLLVDDVESLGLPSGLQDLDGDSRLDLVTVTLDFSVLQAARALATKRISIGLDFLVHCQDTSGRFHRVPGLDLAGKFQVDLEDLRLGRLSQFAGDFDGDGRLDFVQLGRGRRVSVHRGGPGCTYPTKPDFSLDLFEEPDDLALTRVADWNGDGRADLAIVRALDVASESTAGGKPVALDLYLSRPGGVR